MAGGAFRLSLLIRGRSTSMDPMAEDTTMNHWYMTERIAQERHADFQREVDVPTLLTSLEDLPNPNPGPIDRLIRSVDRIRAWIAGTVDRHVGGTGTRPLSGVGDPR